MLIDAIYRDHRQATSSVVGECIKQKFLNPKTIYKPKDILRDMLYDLGVSLSYEKDWRPKEKAMEIIRGKPDISYHLVPSNTYKLKKINPGSMAKLKKKLQ